MAPGRLRLSAGSILPSRTRLLGRMCHESPLAARSPILRRRRRPPSGSPEPCPPGARRHLHGQAAGALSPSHWQAAGCSSRLPVRVACDRHGTSHVDRSSRRPSPRDREGIAACQWKFNWRGWPAVPRLRSRCDSPRRRRRVMGLPVCLAD